MSVFVLVLSTLLIATTAVRAEAILGCYIFPQVLEGYENDYFLGSWCPDDCTAQGTLYTYDWFFRDAAGELEHRCHCSDTPPSVAYLKDGGTCLTTVETVDMLVFVNTARWDFFWCYRIPHPSPAFTPVITALECMDHCEGYQFASIHFDDNSDPSECRCHDASQDWSGQEKSDCSVGDYWVYVAMSTTPSDFVKRKQMRADRERLVKKGELCPVGTTACNILEGQGLSYECIDIRTELESCGGCLQGRFGVINATEADRGTDCTTLPGVKKDGVTCSNGRCVAFACEVEEGYQLLGGSCETR